MGDDVGKSVASTEQIRVKFISKKSPDYKLEFINGALSNITPRGEIICDFHFQFKDMPVEQEATILEDGKAELLGFNESNTFTRDVKFGIVMNSPFAKDLVRLLNDKIKECDEMVLARGKKGDGA
jgi:hypothetical protein